MYYKFIIAYLIFAILSFVTVSTVISSMMRSSIVDQNAESLYKEASLVAKSYAGHIYSGTMSVETARMQLSPLAVYLDCPIWIIDSTGRILLDTDNVNANEQEKYIDGFDPSSAKSFFMIGDFYRNFKEETLSVFAPITAGYTIRGYVVIHMPMKVVISERDRYLNNVYIAMVMLFGLSLIILIVFSEVVYIPLCQITTATEEYAKGNYDYPLKVDRADEMGYLAATLSYMASEISRTEDNQKKFVANVSHDFRSPLTSIRGYLEAMLDGTIPQELYEKYHRIVLNETERLTKLTNSLLQLNNLNIKGILLEQKDFDINGVIKRTAETFEGTCMEKRISIQLVLTGKTMYIRADESKIQQVLYNLLDNAIKFSHHDSVIKIETTEKNDKLFVSVKDTGIGIPKDSLGLVFDRFYKTDISRGRDKMGTGLGLAITKEIIQAHNENINVISTEGVGTEFIFSVRKSKKLEG